jgi:periplasmic copper chaperone A
MRSVLAPAILLASLTAGALAHDFKVGLIEIAHPWSRATPKGATVAGGYLKITNTGTVPDRLTGGSAEVAKRFELHEMRMNDGVMTMRELKGGLDIPPGKTVELKPGSYHVMLTGLARPLAKGEKLKGTLTFEKAGKVDVEFTVEGIGANPHRH